jgi:hypothetical protein
MWQRGGSPVGGWKTSMNSQQGSHGLWYWVGCIVWLNRVDQTERNTLVQMDMGIGLFLCGGFGGCCSKNIGVSIF